MQKKKKQD